MAGSPYLAAKYNYQKAFRNRFCYADLSNSLSIPFGCVTPQSLRKN